MQIDTRKLKKLITKAVPYVAFSYVGNLIGFAYRTAEGNGFQEKILPFMSNLGVAFARIFPSLHPFDLLFGLVLAGVMRLVLYVKSKNKKKFRQGEEYGSAVWGGEKDIEPYMDLRRKENNLRKAQARFDKVSRRTKQFQIDFRREQNRRGRFHTHAHIVRGEKTHHGGRGIIHKFANAKYRITGDAPSVTRTIKSWQPKTVRGKLFKANVGAVNFAVHDVGQTAVDTALAAETVGLKTSDIAQREVRNKLKQKYTREAVDDYHRGVFLMGRTATDAVKGVHNHLKTKKQYKLEKAKLQLKKADNKLYKAKTQKPKMAATKADLKQAKAEYKAKVKPAHGNKLRKAMNKRRLQAYKQTKRELKFERKQLKTESKFRTKELRNQRKIVHLSDPGLLALKPATYTAGRMKASAWQKAVNEDRDNDFLHAIDSAKKACGRACGSESKQTSAFTEEGKTA
ncbi:MAG TPA: hypothetical protein P5191_11010 [Ruminococcus sp.]|nr:hypothetical protein [Ruminococcus sp.]